MFSLECHVHFNRSIVRRTVIFNKVIALEEIQTFDALYIVDKILLDLNENNSILLSKTGSHF